MRLRYTGIVPTTVQNHKAVTVVEPGSEFVVPDTVASRFLPRGDIEETAPDTKPLRPRMKARKAPAVAQADDETPDPID